MVAAERAERAAMTVEAREVHRLAKLDAKTQAAVALGDGGCSPR